MWRTPWVLLTSAFFHWKLAILVISQSADIDCILIHNLYFLNFFEFLKVVLINMVAILMMSTKLVILGLLKTKVFWNKGHDVIFSVYDVTSKMLSRFSNYIVEVVLWPKFGNSNIFMGEVIIISILQGFD